MILVCPSCGARHSAEAWDNDAHTRRALQCAAELPASVGKVIFGYLRLFHDPDASRGMSWDKAGRLLAEIHSLVLSGYVGVDRKPARPAKPEMWAEGIRKMLDNSTLKRPFKSHFYLIQIVYDLADNTDRERETSRNASERAGTYRQPSAPFPQERVEVAEMRRIRQQNMPRGAYEPVGIGDVVLKQIPASSGCAEQQKDYSAEIAELERAGLPIPEKYRQHEKESEKTQT